MQTYLPDIVDPWKLAAAGGCLQGAIPLQRMPRLKPLLGASAGQVAVVMQAGVDEQHVHFFTGHLEATVEMVCQRCMSPLRLPMAVDFRLGLAHSESEAAELPEQYEPLLASEGRLAMLEWVEDELILALPLVPMHNDARECEALGFVLPGSIEAAPEDKPNPFAALSKLFDK